jgi:drug/metabolite transporter (DMT)-like permease
MVLAMSGVVALTLGGRADTDASNPLWGNALELAAMACAAANMLLVKKLCRRYDPWTLTALQVLAGTIFFAPGLRSLLSVEAAVWSIELIGALFFLGADVTLGAFGLYNWGMSRMPASRASIYINLVPLIAVMLGWLLLNERLSPFQGLAAVVVVVGVLLSQRR